MNSKLLLLGLAAVAGAVVFTRWQSGRDRTSQAPPQTRPSSPAVGGSRSTTKNDVASDLIGLADSVLDLWSSRTTQSEPTGTT